jgi:hypothetical protein
LVVGNVATPISPIPDALASGTTVSTGIANTIGLFASCAKTLLAVKLNSANKMIILFTIIVFTITF